VKVEEQKNHQQKACCITNNWTRTG